MYCPGSVHCLLMSVSVGSIRHWLSFPQYPVNPSSAVFSDCPIHAPSMHLKLVFIRGGSVGLSFWSSTHFLPSQHLVSSQHPASLFCCSIVGLAIIIGEYERLILALFVGVFCHVSL